MNLYLLVRSASRGGIFSTVNEGIKLWHEMGTYRERDFVDPRVLHVVEGERVASPDHLRVDVGDGDVSDDNLLSVLNAQPLALNSALAV